MARIPQVMFVNMPFAYLDGPALGISILKSILERSGYKVDIAYLNILFAEIVGRETYCDAFKYNTTKPESNDYIPFDALAGEWAFSQNFYGGNGTRVDCYVNDVLKQAPWK